MVDNLVSSLSRELRSALAIGPEGPKRPPTPQRPGAEATHAETESIASLHGVGREGRDAEDARLVALARRDGTGVAAAVYDRFGDEVNALVWRLLGPDVEHDDVVHDALVQILSGLATVRDPKALHRWVMSVTINTVRGQIRRRRLHRLFHRSDETAISEAMSPTIDHEGRELVRRTARLLDKLSGEQRIAFVLRYVERRSLEEVAELCECSLATIKRRILAANKRLQKLASADPLLAPRVVVGPRRRQRVVD